ncbi:MAG: hypothetical protein ACRBDI_03340 [Alphaproteobacteria bacterium]
MRFLYLFLAIVLVFVSANSVLAQHFEIATADTDYEDVYMPELFTTSVVIDNDSQLPKEPNLPQIDYIKIPEINSLDERISRLIQGIKTDVAPEYDHYGYEIRRYMARVGNIEILKDGEDDLLIENIKNVRKARVIAEYWKKQLESELEDIRPLVEADGVSFSSRTAFKQNTGTVRTFLISLMAWIDANERVLMNVFDNPGVYDVSYPEVVFVKPILRVEYFNLMTTRAQKLKDIRQYTSFAFMVY